MAWGSNFCRGELNETFLLVPLYHFYIKISIEYCSSSRLCKETGTNVFSLPISPFQVPTIPYINTEKIVSVELFVVKFVTLPLNVPHWTRQFQILSFLSLSVVRLLDYLGSKKASKHYFLRPPFIAIILWYHITEKRLFKHWFYIHANYRLWQSES